MVRSTPTTKAPALEPFMCGIPLKPIEGDPLKDEQVKYKTKILSRKF
jgi:hypothetical protein